MQEYEIVFAGVADLDGFLIETLAADNEGHARFKLLDETSLCRFAFLRNLFDGGDTARQDARLPTAKRTGERVHLDDPSVSRPAHHFNAVLP